MSGRREDPWVNEPQEDAVYRVTRWCPADPYADPGWGKWKDDALTAATLDDARRQAGADGNARIIASRTTVTEELLPVTATDTFPTTTTEETR